jgi:hypothetical protein
MSGGTLFVGGTCIDLLASYTFYKRTSKHRTQDVSALQYMPLIVLA